MVNVETESADPGSLLNFYKSLIKLRSTEPALRSGDYVTLNAEDAEVFSFLRRPTPAAPGRSIVVALNMSGKARTVSFTLATQNVAGTTGVVLESNYAEKGTKQGLERVELPPFGALVLGVN